MSVTFSRRRFLGSFGATMTSLFFARSVSAAAPPKEGGLSSEGLLAGHAGFQRRSAFEISYEELPGFLSKEQLAAHYREYVAMVTRLYDTEDALRNQHAGDYAELRRKQVMTANSVLLHEFYFSGLTGTKVEPTRYIVAHVNEHMGTWDAWQHDFRQCALAAKAWAALVYDPYDDRWHNVIMDSDDDGVWIGANPLVVCDVSDHAFGKDYAAREQYVTKFFDHIDWEEVSRRYRAVDRM